MSNSIEQFMQDVKKQAISQLKDEFLQRKDYEAINKLKQLKRGFEKD